jgi:hypothetical protein
MRARRKFGDLSGQKFERWTVIGDRKVIDKKVFWFCRCECESKTERYVRQEALVNGKSLSCGCLQKEFIYNYNKKYNEYKLSEDGKYYTGLLENGKYFYIDAEDFEIANKYYWSENKAGYLRNSSGGKGFHLHVLVMFKRFYGDRNLYVDHIGHNLLDCRKNNLRFVTPSQSAQNEGLQKNNTSGCTGVHWHKQTGMWRATIIINGEYITIGHFNDLDKAIKARKEAEEKYQKEYSYKNSMELYNNMNEK